MYSERPLLDGGAHNIITVGAFVGPMTPGTHTVEIRGGVYGEQFRETYQPVNFMVEDYVSSVNVGKS